jgi:hypothetical protein
VCVSVFPLFRVADSGLGFGRGQVRAAPPEIVGLTDISDHSVQTKSSVPLHIPLFEAIPARLDIASYTAFSKSEYKISLRNRDTVRRAVPPLRLASPLPCRLRSL